MPRKRSFNYGKYKMTASDYNFMLNAQKGVCAICKKKPVDNKRLHVDHDHDSGVVRSLLCGPCNRFIGLAYENPEVLREAAKYIEDGGHPSRFYVKPQCD